MATFHHISSFVHITILSWCLTYGQPAIAQIGPEPKKFGPEITRLEKNKTAQLRKDIADIYAAEVGTLEIGKNNHGPGPKKYLASCGLPEGYPYCACFVKWVLTTAGIPTDGGTAWSPSWFPKSKVIWKNNDPLNETKSKKPQQGDIFGLYFSNLKRIGHVGFIDIWEDPRADGWVFTVEGNTNGDGSREGDGVYYKRRLKSKIHQVANWIDHD